MPLVSHSESDYSRIKAQMTRATDDYVGSYLQVSSVIGKFWADFLSTPEMQVLNFIVCRTLLFRKKAEAVSPRHFLEGIEGVCGPCGVSKNTLRKAIGTLSERGFITVHAFTSGQAEWVWRVYEVNPEAIIANYDVEEVSKLAKRLLETGSKDPLQEMDDPLHQLEYRTSLLRNERTSTNVDVSALLPTPKKGRKARVAVDCKPSSTTAHELVAAIAQRSTENRKARAANGASMPATKWSSVNLQAILDAARHAAQADGYTTPRVVVVSKAIGTLYTRMKEAEIANPLDFFTWVLKNWENVASANQRAKARQAREAKVTSSAMSLSPSFSQLAYRCPYFIAFYNDREQAEINKERQETQRQTRKRNTQASSQEYLATRRAQVREADMAREQQRQQQEADTTQRVRRSRAVDDDEIPQYRGRSQGNV